MIPTPTLRPVYRCPGSKWRLSERINRALPRSAVYVEPFFGSGAVLFGRERSPIEVINDLDSRVVNLFQVLRSDPEALSRALEMTPYSREEYTLAEEDEGDPIERARRLLVRSWQGHGSKMVNASGWRRNLQPGGRDPLLDWLSLPARILNVAERLRGVYIENRDALQLIQEYDSPDCSLYIDPPYHPLTMRERRRFYRHELSEEEHGRLLGVLLAHSGAVALSGYAHPAYELALEGWTLQRFDAMADGGRPRIECLWLNAKAAERMKE